MPTRDEKLKIRILGDAKSAEAAFAKARASAERSLNAVAAAAAAVTAALSAVALRSIEAGDNLAKTADKLGVSTKALSELRYAGELAGVSANTMDMALQRMTRRLAEAAQGTGEAKGALEELGLSAAELVRLPTDQQLARIADAMQKIPTQADRVRLAFKLFDSEGVALVNTLADGSEGLKKAAEEARALGVSLSRIDVARMELANDAMLRAQKAIEGVSNEIAIALSPWIVTVANQFVAWAKTGVDASKDVHDGASQVVDIFAELADTLDVIEYGWIKLSLGFSVAKAKVLDAIVEIDEKFNELLGIGDGDSFLVKNFNNFLHSVPVVGEYLDGLTAKHKDLKRAATDAWSEVKQKLDDLDSFLAKDPGSKRLKKFVANVYATADAQAKIIADRARSNLGAAGAAGESPAVIKAREEARKVIDIHSAKWREIEIMANAAYVGEVDRLLAQQEAKFALLDEERQRLLDAVAVQIEDERARREALATVNLYYDDLKAQQAQQTADRIYQINKQAADAEMQLEKEKQRAKLQAAQQIFGSLSALMNTESRKAFEVGKAAAIAETVVRTYSSAQKAFDSMVGIPVVGPALGAAAAAAAIAAGIARVQAIANTQFGSKGAGVASGGGTPNVGGGGVPVPSRATQPSAPSTQPQQPQQHVVIYVNGVISQDQLVNEIVPQALRDQINNNDLTLIDPQSAQGRMFRSAV